MRKWKEFLIEGDSKKELRTYASFVLIINEEGKVLILKKPDNFERHGGLWTFPGGGNLEEETPLDTAVREVMEETGVELDKNSLIFLDSFAHEKKPKHFFKTRCRGCEKVNLKAVQDEHSDFKWIRADELDNYSMISGMEMLIRKAFGQLLL